MSRHAPFDRFDPALSCARRRLIALALGAACLLGLQPAIAADTPADAAKTAPKSALKPAAKVDAKAREGSLGKGTGALLSREQLRQCLSEQGRLKQEAADTLQAQRALEKDKVEIDRTGVELKAELAALDRTSQTAVDEFNARAQTRDKLIDSYQAATPLFNERVEKLDDARQRFAKDCADRRYREDDFDAIKAGK